MTGSAGVGSVLLVTNPLSGHGRGQAAGAVAAARMRARGVRVDELSGTSAAESVRLVRDRLTGDDVPDVVVCAGGDGLVCITLQALAGTGVPLGLVPGGTGNDLARELGVPQDDPISAADIVLGGTIRTIDLGAAEVADPGSGSIESGSGAMGFGIPGPITFATVAGTGLDARVTLRANRMRFPKGRLRYTFAALAELTGRLTVPYRLELSGVPGQSVHSVIETEAVMVAVGNTRTYGGGMLVCPDALVDDGLLEVSVVGAMSRPEMVRLLPALASGKRLDHPAISQYRAATVELSAPGAPVTADGEPVGMLPTTFRALPGALPVLVP
ncbi:diacylglycerol kinase family protein [Nocardia macrotermitis]|uniref:Diacylglycerol kinase n=1 Tax=Nocardia macrotermitis TaxID=2585198 RepID=A0A7K0D3U1_9NOCA|nr:diacylglycerol kinase family protein [Nocardia macrotermitis]MQY20390.1 Diacylglycerol kinase [Nocardia macrotermitis]